MQITVIIFIGLVTLSGRVSYAELPTTLVCTSNARAERDFQTMSSLPKVWSGQKGHTIDKEPFRIITKDQIKIKRDGKSWERIPLSDKVFSGMDTMSPIVRSIARFQDGTEDAAEFKSAVVSRTHDGVYLVWRNDAFNQVWMAFIDLVYLKAIVTHTYRGGTSLGGTIESLDCR